MGIKLNATTKGAMELTHAAMEKTIKATSAKSDKILAEATEKAKEAVAGVKADFDAKHVSLKSEHGALDQKVKEGKEETDKNLAEAKLEAKDETTAAKKELETTLEKQGTKFTKHLNNHDTNHEITEKYILYHDDAENWEGLSEKQKKRYDGLTWKNRPAPADKTPEDPNAAPAGEATPPGSPPAEASDGKEKKETAAPLAKKGDDAAADTGNAKCVKCGAKKEVAGARCPQGGMHIFSKGKDNVKNGKARRRLVPMTPSEHVLTRRRLVDRPKSHCTVLETLLEEINRLN